MQRVHSFVWLAWLGLVLGVISLTRNPYYMILLWLWVAITNVATRTSATTIWNSAWTLWASLGIVPVSGVFNALTTHFGEHILFIIPGNIPLISGAVTWEALVYGIINGIVLSIIINVFWTFNRNVSIQFLLRLIPRRFYSLAVVSSIAVTFIPITLSQYRQIQEAQAIRGNRVRGVRGLAAILMPLLNGSLERAFQLAEVLTARGFHQPQETFPILQRWLTLLGIACIFLGWQGQRLFSSALWNYAWMGKSAFLLGILFLLLPFWLVGRNATHTRYKVEAWQKRDGLGLFGLVCVALGLIWFQFHSDSSLRYSVYPTLTLPLYNPIVGLFLAGLAIPALIQGKANND
ncbi:MAG: energy-coupling factor transporter transmembrane component T [Anaerolineales bacterium]